jgi:hypothetical protein
VFKIFDYDAQGWRREFGCGVPQCDRSETILLPGAAVQYCGLTPVE